MAVVDNVCVKIERNDNQTYVVKVQVLSVKKAKSGLRANVEIDPGKAKTKDALIKLLQVAAGACAEYLGKYGDNIDPSNCTRLVLEAFHAEAHAMKLQTQDAGLKMKAIGDNLSRLGNQQLEVFHAIKKRLSQPGYYAMAKEIKWMNKMLKEIF
jgi:hypothetical protein